MLALSFLLLVGVMLIGEGMHFHIPKGYVYFAMAFSVFVEMLNTKIRRRRIPPLKLSNAMRNEVSCPGGYPDRGPMRCKKG